MSQHTSPRGPQARRRGWAFVCLGAGLLLLSATLVLGLLDPQSMAARLFQATWRWLQTLDLSIILALLAIIGIGVGVIALRRWRQGPRASAPYQRLAHHSPLAPNVLYLDFENQGIRAAQIGKFARHLKQHLGNAHTDLLFFANVTETVQHRAQKQAYYVLRSHGFSQMDIPHRPPDSFQPDVPNMVDMSIVLHAMERAMLAEAPQHFIFVAADLDYLPLIYTLLRMGHRVSVWAREVPDRYHRLREELGVEIWEFADIFGGNSAHTAAATSRAIRATVREAIRFTWRAYDDALLVTASKRRDAFLRQLADEKSAIRQIGFHGERSITLWLLLLHTLGILQPDINQPPLADPISPEAGAELITRMLYEIIACYHQLVLATGKAEVNLLLLGQQLLAERRYQADALSGLRELLSHNQNLRLLRLLCHSADALGIIRLAEPSEHDVIINPNPPNR